ncbi:MAG: hypothetical protein ISS70_09470 [Phycisphaerae bacterium]|nr:hypothetical protein [Phycisphaerae bacterium]
MRGDFHTSVGLYRYSLHHKGLKPGEYASAVTVSGNNVDFTLDVTQDPEEGKFEFGYTIQPGQPNPSTFFANQTAVVFSITNVPAPEIAETATKERDPNVEYLTIEEAMRRCESNDLPGVKVFPYRGTRFGGAPIMAHRDGDDIIVKQPTYVRSNRDFLKQTNTLPISTFIGGVRLKPNEVVRVHTYEPRWYHLNITGSTEGDIENEFCVTGEQMLQIAEMSTSQTFVNIGLTVVDAALFLIPVGKIVTALGKPILRGSRNIAIGAMLGLREAAPTAFAGIASRTGTVLVENQLVSQTASRAITQTTSHVIIDLGEHTIAQTVTRAGAPVATSVGTRAVGELGGRTIIVTMVDSAGHQVASSFTTPTGHVALDAALDRSFRETFDQPGSQLAGQQVGSTVAPEIAAGFTRQQVIAFKGFIAKPFSHSDIRVLETLWTQAARQGDDAILNLANSRYLFNLHRNRFWRLVRENSAAKAIFENAGCVFAGKRSTAPYFTLNGRRIKMTIDHIIERQTAPHLALTGSNLRISFSRENSVVLRLLNQLDPFQRAGN